METLSNLGTPKVDAEQKTNVTGQMTDVLTFSPIDGLRLTLDNIVNGETGIPIYLDLKDGNGDDLPLDTTLTLRFDAPHLDQTQVVAYSLSNIRQYVNLSIKDQQNADYRDRTRISLKGRSLIVEDTESVSISIKSDTQIDWSQSQAYIDTDAATVDSGN